MFNITLQKKNVLAATYIVNVEEESILNVLWRLAVGNPVELI